MLHPELVDETKLQSLIEQLPHLDEAQKHFLKTRWLHQLRWWDDRSRGARTKYFRYRAAVIVGGVAIPVISGLPDSWALGNVPKVLVAVLGAVVAGCSAWEGVANYGEVWREKRRAAELLKVEAWQFFQLAEKYKKYPDRQAAYSTFAGEVERLIAKEIGEYVAVFEPKEEDNNQNDGSSSGRGGAAT